jgi:hypothetical protein
MATQRKKGEQQKIMLNCPPPPPPRPRVQTVPASALFNLSNPNFEPGLLNAAL